MSTAPTPTPTEVVPEVVAPPAVLPEGVDALETLADGKMHVKLATGEDFTGTPIEIAGKMGSAHVSTKRWAQALRDAKPQPAAPPAPLPPSPEEQQAEQLRSYLLEQQALGLGYTNAQEMKTDLQNMRQTAELTQDDRTAAEFHASCWDFPATPEATEKLFDIGANFGIFQLKDDGQLAKRPTAKQLAAAHAVALQHGAYKALTREEYMAQASAGPPQRTPTPTPPPVISPTQPETSSLGDKNPWAMTTDEIRAEYEKARAAK